MSWETRYTIRIEDHDIEFVHKVPVNIQVGRYMDPYGAMYLLIENPYNMDKW